ncbi:hypothetical protein K505DRAFT_360974 [Melanomma pulvis-pyrius CBS 109.77]|uniref:Uncharacterized protein n=1 Tax=Melanomma pulvis-pyrius CBS 109.77 TaxID=1314802 RepID=A0A6A6XDH4_9PLEO|nr:hypothetical protein K505DRAFT_360974 [Melanomma pulvis-pyrius CBS 109.77]
MRFGAQECVPHGGDKYCWLPEEFEGDGDIAGPGVLFAFVVGAAISLISALVVLIFEGIERFRREHPGAHAARDFFDSLVVGFSDTQLITSLALLASTYFRLGCKISAYHYDLVCNLVLISSAAHIGPVAVMHRYYDRFKGLGILRFCLILPSFVLTWILIAKRNDSNIFPTYKPNSTPGGNNTALVLHAACLIDHPGAKQAHDFHNFTASIYWTTWFTNTTISVPSNSSSQFTNSTILTNRTIPAYSNFSSDDTLKDPGDMTAFGFLTGAFVLTSLLSVAQKYVHKTNLEQKTLDAIHRAAVILKTAALITCFGIAIWSYTRFQTLHSWMQKSDWLRDDDAERSPDSFGQLVPLVLLALPFLTIFEQLVAQSPDKDSDQEKNDNESTSNMRLRSMEQDR